VSSKARTLLFVFGFMALMLGILFARVLSPVPISKEDLRKQGFYLLDQPRPIANFHLFNHKGQSVTQKTLTDKWSIVFFGYTTCPDVCPTTLALMNQVYQQLTEEQRAQLQVVLVSVDPERDTVEKLSQYIPYFNADFLGLTGDLQQITNLATTVSTVFAKTQFEGESYLVDHSGNLVLLNPVGQYVGFFRSPHDVNSLLKLLPALLGEQF